MISAAADVGEDEPEGGEVIPRPRGPADILGPPQDMPMLVQNIFKTYHYTQNVANDVTIFQDITVQHFQKVYADLAANMQLVWHLAQNAEYLNSYIQMLIAGCAQQQVSFNELPKVVCEVRTEALGNANTLLAQVCSLQESNQSQQRVIEQLSQQNGSQAGELVVLKDSYAVLLTQFQSLSRDIAECKAGMITSRQKELEFSTKVHEVVSFQKEKSVGHQTDFDRLNKKMDKFVEAYLVDFNAQNESVGEVQRQIHQLNEQSNSFPAMQNLVCQSMVQISNISEELGRRLATAEFQNRQVLEKVATLSEDTVEIKLSSLGAEQSALDFEAQVQELRELVNSLAIASAGSTSWTTASRTPCPKRRPEACSSTSTTCEHAVHHSGMAREAKVGADSQGGELWPESGSSTPYFTSPVTSAMASPVAKYVNSSLTTAVWKSSNSRQMGGIYKAIPRQKIVVTKQAD